VGELCKSGPVPVSGDGDDEFDHLEDEEAPLIGPPTRAEVAAKQLEEFESLRQTRILCRKVEDEKDIEMAVEDWEANRFKSTQRRECTGTCPIRVTAFLLALGGVLVFATHYVEISPVFGFIVLACGLVTIVMPWPRLVGIPNLTKEMIRVAKEANIDPELYMYLCTTTALTSRGQTLSNQVNHFTRKWINENRKDWTAPLITDQISRAVIITQQQNVIESVAFSNWARSDYNKGMWRVANWVKTGNLGNGSYWRKAAITPMA
jgi:hypothetical protein